MKARRYKQRAKADRDAWRDEMPDKCMACGRHLGGFWWPEVHEIERKGQAQYSWAHRCNYLKLCHPCHTEMDDYSIWPHARQLALKQRMDPEHFDLAAWLAIKPRPETYVTEDEIRRAA
jgi:hypothetical protein